MEELRKELDDFLKKIKTANSVLIKEKSPQIRKTKIINQVKDMGQVWFDVLRTKLTPVCEIPLLDKYDSEFKALTQLSLSYGNKRTSYLSHFKNIMTSFNKEIILGVHTSNPKAVDINHAVFNSLISDISNPEEGEYLMEAIECAKHNYTRASIVLGWCATIDRIHKKIEEIGFTKFNVAAAQMASVTTGRFKRFSGVEPVTSISELRGIFDDKVLWVLEGMTLIDMNQHTRLRSCFEMRNQSAHPGDAPITPYNLMSFFSDIKEIIFKNKNFSIVQTNSTFK